MFGKKAKFIVTPKRAGKTSFLHAIKSQICEIIFSTLLIVVALIFTKSVLPVALIAVTGYLSIFLTFLSNKIYGEYKYKSDDAFTEAIILKQNYAYKLKKTLSSTK